MRQKPTSETRTLSAESELDTPIRQSVLDGRGAGTWILGAIGFLLVVGSLVGATYYLASNPASDSEDFLSRNQPVLMVILVLTNLLFLAYAAYQQHMVLALRRARHHRRLLALLTVARNMGAETNLQNIFDSITGVCRKAFPCDQVSLMQHDPESGNLVVCSASGHRDLSLVLGSELPVGKSIAGWVAQHREPIILGPRIDREQFTGFEPKAHNLSTAMVVPIILRNELYGVLSVSSRARKVDYDEEDLEALLVFAETAGICCRHSEQSNWMRQTIQRMDEELTRQDGSRRAA